MWFFFSSRGGGGASRASCGPTAARVVCFDSETPVAATKKMKTPHQNLRQEQHDVRREAPVIFIMHDQSAGHPAGL